MMTFNLNSTSYRLLLSMFVDMTIKVAELIINKTSNGMFHLGTHRNFY